MWRNISSEFLRGSENDDSVGSVCVRRVGVFDLMEGGLLSNDQPEVDYKGKKYQNLFNCLSS